MYTKLRRLDCPVFLINLNRNGINFQSKIQLKFITRMGIIPTKSIKMTALMLNLIKNCRLYLKTDKKIHNRLNLIDFQLNWPILDLIWCFNVNVRHLNQKSPILIKIWLKISQFLFKKYKKCIIVIGIWFRCQNPNPCLISIQFWQQFDSRGLIA